MEDNTKVWWQSKTVWFILFTMLSIYLKGKGYITEMFGQNDIAMFVDSWMPVVPYLSGALALVSRYVSTHKITLFAPAASTTA
jgi:hypothetical protein